MLYSSHILLLTLLFGQSGFSNPLIERDNCPSGTTLMAGDSYDVCCPGKAVVEGSDPYCCIGKKQDDKKDKRRVCVGLVGCDDDDNDDYGTKSCSVAVPATANDFSDRVAQATATITDEPDEDAANLLNGNLWILTASSALAYLAALG